MDDVWYNKPVYIDAKTWERHARRCHREARKARTEAAQQFWTQQAEKFEARAKQAQ